MKENQPVVSKFIDPLLDFSFKRIFGTEPNQDLLIALLNGIFRGRKEIKSLVFYDDLGFIYIELANFAKEESELETDLDSWLYVLKHMSKLNKIPLYLRKPIFEKLFNIAEYSKLTKEEKEMYDTSLKRKWDTAGALEYARREGEEKGIEKWKASVVANLVLDFGFDDEQAARASQTSIDFVRKVRADLTEKKK